MLNFNANEWFRMFLNELYLLSFTFHILGTLDGNNARALGVLWKIVLGVGCKCSLYLASLFYVGGGWWGGSNGSANRV